MIRRLGVVVITAVVAGVLAAAPVVAQDGDGSGAAASTVPDGVYTPNDRTGGVEVWGAVPWDADFLAGWNEIGDLLDACGFYEREWKQCDNPADKGDVLSP